MPVSDFECQIVRGQIGRYIDGGVLSPAALTGLEEHLAECADCKAAVAERRATLLGTLGKPTHAVVSMPVENPLIAALRARAEADKVPVEEPAPTPKAPRYTKGASAKPRGAKPNLTKPLALAALLAAVLLGMGRFSRTATAPNVRASAAFAAESLPTTPAPVKAPRRDPERKPVPKPVPVVTPVAVKPKPIASKPKATIGDLFVSSPRANPDVRESAPTPKARPVGRPQVVRRPVPIRHLKRTARRPKASHRKVARRPSGTTVRVYGLDGRPLKP